MRVVLIILASCLGMAYGDEPKVESTQAEMKKLEGTWVMTHMSRKGFKVPLPVEVVIVFGTDGSVVQREKGQPEKKSTYRVDPSKSPREIDFLDADGKLDMLGIYERDGDTFRFGASDDGDSTKNRLDKFDAANAYLWYLKRQKK